MKLDPQRFLRSAAVTGLLIAVGWFVFYVLLPHTVTATGSSSGHWQTPSAIVMKGVVVGVTYGLLGVGLVLIYRSSRVINFAHGNIGAFGSVLFVLLVQDAHFPYWLALVPALVGGGLVGAVAEAAVVRRLRNAPLVMSVVATLGFGQFLLLIGGVLVPSSTTVAGFPAPPGLPTFRVGVFFVDSSYFAMLVFSSIVVVALGLFLRLSRFGIGLRCAADNPDAARMAGIFAGRMSTLAWGLGAAVATLTAILTAPAAGSSGGTSLGPNLLEVALAAAVIGRMENMPVTLLAGTGIGVVQQLVIYNFAKAGFYQVILFALIGGALLLQKQRTGRNEAKGSWAAVQPPPSIPRALKKVPAIRAINPVIIVVLIGVMCLLPSTMTAASAVTWTSIFAFCIIGLSVGIVTGLAGQLSLGQFAIGGIGALASYEVALRTHDFYLSFAYAGIAAAAASVLVGLPALRVKGLLLTVTTLSFALVVPYWLLAQDWSFGDGINPGTPTVFGQVLTQSKHYYFFALGLLLLSLVLARNVRRGGLGRLFVAVRDNEDAARAFTVRATAVKVQGFAIAGFLAGVGGALYVHSLPQANGASFDTQYSIDVLVMAVIGGLGTLTGPLLGALIVRALPAFVSLGALGLAGQSLGQLLIIMYLPGGLSQLVPPLRDRLVRFLGARSKVDVAAAYLGESSSGLADQQSGVRVKPDFVQPRQTLGRRGVPVLQASGLVKSFGGVKAVRGVSFDLNRGEILGLIGPNGAGKTTTFELLAGFTPVDSGRVLLHGEDVSDLGPEARGQRGLIRSFQDAALFPTLTVLECVQLSLERTSPTKLLTSLAGLTGSERTKEDQARALVSWMGLDRYRSAQIRSLSTGTRRITEIACLVGLGPEVLLLDEPCAGVAQAETEALTQLLVDLKAELDLTLMIIEHDIPMIMRLSDRIVCMAEGEVIAAGSPDLVRNDPRVVESYLGGSLTAIERSGPGASKPKTPKKKPVRPRTPELVRTAS